MTRATDRAKRRRDWRPNHYRLYSWREDRKASPAAIRHFVAEAVQRKAAAIKGRTPDPDDSSMWAHYIREDLTLSVHALARRALEYCRYRAHMPGAWHGQPGDRPTFELWENLRMSIKADRAKRLAIEAIRNEHKRAADHGANLPGVAPASARDILQKEADRPMRGGNAELPHNSIFGDSHKQKELF